MPYCGNVSLDGRHSCNTVRVQTYHQVHFEGVVELQGWDVVRLLKVVNHEQFSVLETSCALEKLLQTFLTDKKSKCSLKE